MTTQKKKEVPEAGAPAKKPRRMMRMMLMLVGAVLLGGGGLGAALYASGYLATGEEGHVDRPHLVPRAGASAAAVAEAEVQARSGRINPHVFQATYHPLETNFTSNLRGGNAFVQIGLGVSTYYDERVIEHLTKHEMAIRSAILMTLSEQDPLVISTTEGKQQLRQALKNAVNNVLTIKEGFGGIEEVFFTSFVTQ